MSVSSYPDIFISPTTICSTFIHSLPLFLSRSQAHTHSLTHTRSLSLSLSLSLSISLSLSLTLSHTHTLSLSHTHTHSLSLSLSLSLQTSNSLYGLAVMDAPWTSLSVDTHVALNAALTRTISTMTNQVCQGSSFFVFVMLSVYTALLLLHYCA